MRRGEFRDRHEAGDALAAELQRLGELPEGCIVVGLPRGGVVVAARVAAHAGADLDVVVARKVGAPEQPEFGIGAVSEGGARVLDDRSVRVVGVSEDELDELVERERQRVAERVARYRGSLPRLPLTGRHVVVVDDGFATGVTARAALADVAAEHPARVVLAVPVGPPDIAERVAGAADAVVAVLTPPGFRAVGEVYARFDQTSDDEVVELLQGNRTPPPE